MAISFYDRNGAAVAYSDDDVHVFLYGGEPIAYLDADALYSYRGELMGWFEDGWLRDKDGCCVAYTAQASGGPARPERRARPNQSLKQGLPIQQLRDPRALRPIHSNAWSSRTAQEFFANSRHAWPGGMGHKNDPTR